MGLSPAGLLPFAILVIVGAIDIVADVNGTAILQTATPDDLLGRVFGAFEATLISSMLVGALVVGPLIDALGVRAATVVFAVAGLALLLVCLPRLRRLEDAVGVRVFVRRVSVLSSLPHRALDDLTSRMELQKILEGTDIVREGDVGDRLYILEEGEAEVVARGEGEREVEVATLSKNDYFGEIAVLRDVPRTATMRSRAPVELSPWAETTSGSSWSAPRSWRVRCPAPATPATWRPGTGYSCAGEKRGSESPRRCSG